MPQAKRQGADLVGSVSEVASSVAQQLFPTLPVAAAIDLIGEALGKRVDELSDEELKDFLVASLKRQRASLG